MELITVDAEKCKKDGMCAAACPSGALELDADGGPVAAATAVWKASRPIVAGCPPRAGTTANGGAGKPASGPRPNVRQFPSPEVVDGLLLGRRSIRAYADKPVSRAVLEELLDVARYAPTASNVQEIRWIATVDPAKVHELAGLVAAWFIGNGQRPK